MPICKVDNSLIDSDRDCSCYLEHSQSKDPSSGCRGSMQTGQWTFKAVPGRKPALPKSQ